jgi:hypothetical protein
MPLSERHTKLLEEDSRIAPELIAQRGYQTLSDQDGLDTLKQLGFVFGNGRGVFRLQNLPGLLLPIHTVDGQQPYCQFRPDAPRVSKSGEVHKYESPPRTIQRIDIPPICWEHLGNPQQRIHITEGVRKADSLASQGACAIGLNGVFGWRSTNAHGGKTLSPDFESIAWNGRDVVLVPDSDYATNDNVRQAIDRIANVLTTRGATVRIARLSTKDGQKQGVDDFFAAGHSLAELDALLDSPPPPPKLQPATAELLDTNPVRIDRPLALVDGTAYAALWPYVRVTTTEKLDKHGNVVRLPIPEVSTERRLLVVRDDGVLFGSGGTHPLEDLGVEVYLPEMIPADKQWPVPAVKRYSQGWRPDPKGAFEKIVTIVDRFVDFERSLAKQSTMCELVSCYVLATWFLPSFTVIGYLWPNGEKGAGKTKLLEIIGDLAYLGQTILAGGSYACLRDMADYGACLGFDDAENVMDLKRGDPDKRALLLAGNRVGSSIPVKEPVNGREWRTRYVRTFCPRLFSAIRLPDDVLASRTIIIPLIRTPDPYRANADHAVYTLWPFPREDVLGELWALALTYTTKLAAYEARTVGQAALNGRVLEPWRAVLAVALWLEDFGMEKLWTRMHDLAIAYQEERTDLEASDLTALLIRALLHYSISSVSSINVETPEETELTFTTSSITEHAQEIATDQEIGINPDTISSRRVGRTLSKLRLQEKPRKGSGGKRQWQCTKGFLRRLFVSYGEELPEEVFGKEGTPPSPKPDDKPDDKPTETKVSEMSAMSTPLEGDTPRINGANGFNGANGALSQTADRGPRSNCRHVVQDMTAVM